MCGRYSLTSTGGEMWDLIDRTVPAAMKPPQNVIEADFEKQKWQIAPNDWVRAIFPDGYTMAHWWLLPSWMLPGDFKWRVTGRGEKSFTWAPGKRYSHFNCRQETLTDPSKNYWFKLLGTQRCLIPANGFIEWSDAEMLKKGEKKRSALFYLKEHKPYFFAGVYDIAIDDQGRAFPSVNIVTTQPNELLDALPNDRMPAILRDEDVAAWMDSKLGNKEAAKLIRPTPKEEMEFHFLGPLINKAANDVPEALEPFV